MDTFWDSKLALWGLGLLCLLLCTLSACGIERDSETAKTGVEVDKEMKSGEDLSETDILEKQSSPDTNHPLEIKKPNQTSSKTVLDYFRALPEPYALPYTLAKKDRLWYVTHIPSGRERQALVDLDNGYMELSDLRSDSESESVQVALFYLKDDRPVLGVCRTQVVEDQVSQQYFFVRPGTSGQFDWSEHTVPVFAAQDFFRPETPELDSEYLEDAFPVLLKLPHYGEELLVQPYLGRRFYYCGELASAEEQRLCPLYDQLARRSFRLNWNPATGRFE